MAFSVVVIFERRLNSIPLPLGQPIAHTQPTHCTICYELSGFPLRGALARRPASRQQKGAVSRREPRAIGSRRERL